VKTSVRDKALLYHLTAADNLSDILRAGLLSRQDLRAQGKPVRIIPEDCWVAHLRQSP